MIDSVGNVSSILAAVAANPLALATIDRLTGPRLKQATLLDHDAGRCERVADRVQAFGVPDVISETYLVDDVHSQSSAVDEAFARRDIDVVLVAALPESEFSEAPTGVQAVSGIRSALIDPVTIAEAAFSGLVNQGHGILVLYTHSSAASHGALDRTYCAAMAGLSVLAPSFAHRATDTGVRIINVRVAPNADPSASSADSSAAWIKPTDVASAIAAEVATTRKSTRSATLSLPKTWRRMMPSQRNSN